jgi:hypothetical protein
MAYSKLEYDSMMANQMKEQLAKETSAQETSAQENSDNQQIVTENQENFSTKEDNTDLSTVESNQPDQNTKSESDEPDDSIENLLNNTFGGDPKKAAKSYLESQKAYVKLREERENDLKRLQEIEGQFQQLDKLFSQHPDLAKQVELAITGKYNENLSQTTEPKGKPMQSEPTGKLSNPTLPTEKDLIDAGLVDPADRNNLPSAEYQQRLLMAQTAYLQQNLPDMIANQTFERIASMQKQRQEQQEQQRLQETNNQRLSDGFDKAIAKYGLDFAGQHASLFDEINNTFVAFRDPKNMGLIAEDAVELAVERVLRANDMLPKATAPSKPEPAGDDGFQSNKSAQMQTRRPNDITSKFEDRMNALNTEQILRRNQNRRFINN